MKLRNGRHGRDAFTAQLSELFSLGGVDIDETIHVADAEFLDAVWRMELPLWSKTMNQNTFYKQG